jgi:hypothetical protein
VAVFVLIVRGANLSRLQAHSGQGRAQCSKWIGPNTRYPVHYLDVAKKSGGNRDRRRAKVRPLPVAKRKALDSEALGRSIRPTQSAYESAASLKGEKAISKALISRHNQRWENVSAIRAAMGEQSLETLHSLFPVDVALFKLGADRNRHPASMYGEWPDHLEWGIDSVCAAVRMLLTGNAITAAAIARSQLERWNSNLATSNDLSPQESESQEQFMTRIWEQVHPGCPDAGAIWIELSLFLHGRGPMCVVAGWESKDLVDQRKSSRMAALCSPIDGALLLVLRQIRHCVATLGVENGFAREWADLIAFMDDQFPSMIPFEPPMSTVWPLTLDNLNVFGDSVEALGRKYRDDTAALAGGRKYEKESYWARAREAWTWRRSRAVTFAREAYRQEEEVLGDEFDPTSLRGREQQYVLIAEVSGLLAKWSGGEISDSLSIASGAVRGAYWLWLEDDDRAMAMARIILEQVARMRTHRLKPAKAASLEERSAQTSGRDWLQAAGWKRLSTLSRSVAEFAHAATNAKWNGARQTLADLHTPFSSGGKSNPLQTARGNTLTMVVQLLAQELCLQARVIAPTTAEAMIEALPIDEEVLDARVEDWLNRSWEIRGRDSGSSDFISTEEFDAQIRESD